MWQFRTRTCFDSGWPTFFLGVPVRFQGQRLPQIAASVRWETYLSFLSCVGTKWPNLFITNEKRKKKRREKKKKTHTCNIIGPLHLLLCQSVRVVFKKDICIKRTYMTICIHIDCWYAFEYWQNYFRWSVEAVHFASLQLLLKMKNIYFYFSSSFSLWREKGCMGRVVP